MQRTLLAITLCGSLGAAQAGLIHYRFDDPSHTQIINWSGADRSAARVTTPGYGSRYGFVKGRFGGGLAPAIPGITGNIVDTGFTGPLTGDMTIAMFLQNRLLVTKDSRSGLLGRPGFSLSIGMPWAVGGITLRGWGGPDLHLAIAGGIHALRGWQHFAITIDSKAKTATWYHNGKVVATQAIPGGVSLAKGPPLILGRDDYNPCGGRWDLDEFRLLGRVATPAEIQTWATHNTATYASLPATTTTPPADSLRVTGGLPTIGNSSYAMTMTGPQQAPFLVALGFSKTHVAIGSQLWLTSLDAVVVGVLDDSGTAKLPVAIPQVATLDGSQFHTQGLVLPEPGKLVVTNALSHVIGY